jgi:hypothetical protein
MTPETSSTSRHSESGDTPDLWWPRGEIPKSIDSIYEGLSVQSNSHAHWVAQMDSAAIIRLLIRRVLVGDPACGILLAEAFATLSKNRQDLAEANWEFKQTLLRFESARVAIQRRSNKRLALRRLIHNIIDDARGGILWYRITKEVSPTLEGIDPERFCCLPEFGPDRESIDQWFNVIVFPNLERMKDRLRDDPEIGSMQKALQSGSFQLSALKPLIRQTLIRIAKLPRTAYFDPSDMLRDASYISKRGRAF